MTELLAARMRNMGNQEEQRPQTQPAGYKRFAFLVSRFSFLVGSVQLTGSVSSSLRAGDKRVTRNAKHEKRNAKRETTNAKRFSSLLGSGEDIFE